MEQGLVKAVGVSNYSGMFYCIFQRHYFCKLEIFKIPLCTLLVRSHKSSGLSVLFFASLVST